MAPDTKAKTVRGLFTKRNVALAGIFVLALALVYGTIYMVLSINNASAVRYTPEVITPEESDLCPGEFLRYEVQIEVIHPPEIVQVVESWCEAGESGRCLIPLTNEYKLPTLNRRTINASASVLVPFSPLLVPGVEYELVHAVENGRVTGYIVEPIRIREDCE